MRKVFAVVLVMALLIGLCHAEGVYETYYVLCNPSSFVFIREFPKKDSREGGYLYFGDSVETDGKKKNGYWHVVGVNTEMGEGWVRGLYLDSSEPVPGACGKYVVVSKGKLRARNGVNGRRIGWLKPGTQVVVYGMTDDWAVTNKGYVQAQYLEVDW